MRDADAFRNRNKILFGYCAMLLVTRPLESRVSAVCAPFEDQPVVNMEDVIVEVKNPENGAYYQASISQLMVRKTL